MSGGWTPRDLIYLPVVITANTSALPICQPRSITAGGAQKSLVVGVYVTGIAGTCTVQLQHSFSQDVWENVTGKVTATLVNGWNYIKLNGNLAGDAALMPLFDTMRLTLTSNGSGAGSITSAKLLQEL